MSLTSTTAYELASGLARAAIDGGEADWTAGLERLGGLVGRDWLMLDAAARTFRHVEGMPVSGVRGWIWEPGRTGSLFVTVIASMHVDGRIRERATRMLAGHAGPVSASAVALRLLDHVPQVRTAAHEVLGGIVASTDLVSALQVVLVGRDRLPGNEALAEVESRLREVAGGGGQLVELLMASSARDVRRRGFVLAHEGGILTPDRLIQTARADTDQLVLGWCADWLLELGEPADFAELLDARPAVIRQVAVIRATGVDLRDERLLELTLDRAPRVREAARWRARKRMLDLAGWFREQARSARGLRRASALDGLLEIGDVTDLHLFQTALLDQLPRVRAAAIPGVAALASSQASAAALAPLLLDPSARVASTAARVLGRAGLGSQAAQAAWVSDQPWSRRAAWRLTRSTGGWDRVEADLRAAGDPEPALAGLGNAGLENWIHAHAASTWQPLPQNQRDRIATLLQTWDGPISAKRTVAFHAGIRPLPGNNSFSGQDDPPRRGWWRR